MIPDKNTQHGNTKSTPLAIVGMGCLFPKADTLNSYWANIKNGVDAITEIPESHWRPDDYFDPDPKKPDHTYGQRGGFLSPVDFRPIEFGITPNTIEATDTTQLLGMVAAQQALNDAGYGAEKQFPKDRTSIILGVTGALELVIPLGARLGHPHWRQALRDAGIDEATTEDVVARIADSYVPWQENSFPGLLGNVVAGRISKYLDTSGTNCVVDAACASSLSAMHLACMELETGRSDLVVTGGVDTFNDIFMYMCFSKTPALSPSGNARPFDKNADGTTLGEGVGILLMKRFEDAVRDGDRIYAKVLSIGSSSDGKGEAIYAPSATGQTKALKQAYTLADIEPRTITLVEAHGTGTKAGEAAEIKALREVFGASDTGPWCALGSIKSQIGHTKAAAGAAGVIKAALALHRKTLPPTIKVEEPQDSLLQPDSPFYVNTIKRPWIANDEFPRRAAVSALGFGGSNFHCVLEEHEAQKDTPDWDGDIEILAFSSSDVPGIIKQIDQLEELDSDWSKLQYFAYESRKSFNAYDLCRLLLVIQQSKSDIPGKLQAIRSMLNTDSNAEAWQLPGGIWFSRVKHEGKTAILFPGQGAQYVGMLRDLACQFPEMLTLLHQADALFGEAEMENLLSDVLYPHPVFSKESEQAQEALLRLTQHAQPALGVVSVGACQVLIRFGFNPEAAAGHSYGELPALHAAGVLDAGDFLCASIQRGLAMQACAETHGSGTMAAVQADLETVNRVLEKAARTDVCIANYNTPAQYVLSGSREAVEVLMPLFKEEKVRVIPLQVAAAFHSSMVADAAVPYGEKLASMSFNPGKIPVYANTTAATYPESSEEKKRLLADQLANSVLFTDMIHRMYSDGVRTFVEVGPGARLSGMVKSILDGKTHTTIALDVGNGKNDGIYELACCLAQLAVDGHGLDLTPWNEGILLKAPDQEEKPKLTIRLSGANYRAPYDKRPPRKIEAPKVSQNPATATPVSSGRHQADAKGAPVASSTSSEKQPQHNAATASTFQSGVLRQSTQGIAQKMNSDTNQTIPVDAILQSTRDSMKALQKLQDQTAQLHRQFLENQQTTVQAYQEMIRRQHDLLGGNLSPVRSQPVPVSAPVHYSDNNPVVEQPQIQAKPDTEFERMTSSEIVVAEELQKPVSAVNEDAPSKDTTQIESVLLSTISEKTGYPAEMLELDMSLDADLGIDSIKRVEIMSSLQEALPDAPSIEAQHLGTLQTLRQIVEHLSQGKPASTGGDASVTAPAAVSSDTTQIESVLLSTISEKTGYPAEMLELDMSLDADLGIDSIKRVEIMSSLQEALPDAPSIEAQHLGTLQTLRQIVEHLSQGRPATTGSKASVTIPAGVSSDSKQIESVLLSTISEKTGYPAEMLELDMSLDADLGIDSIKRVEIMSSLQEALPDAPSIEAQHLGTLQTLRQIVEHLSQGKPAITGGGVSLTTPAAVSSDTTQIESVLLSTISEKTGYPAEMLELDMSLDADLGIDSIKRVEIMSSLQEALPDAPSIEAQHLGTLQTLHQIVEHLSQGVASAVDAQSADEVNTITDVPEMHSVDLIRKVLLYEPYTPIEDRLLLRSGHTVLLLDSGDEFSDKLVALLTGQNIDVIRVAPDAIGSITLPDTLNGIILTLPEQATKTHLLHAFSLLQRAGSALLKTASAQNPVLLAGLVHMDGFLGTGLNDCDYAVESGGLAGLIKTATLEWPGTVSKVIDIASNVDITAYDILFNILSSSATGEFGITSDGCVQLVLKDEKFPSVPGKFPLTKDDVVVVTGGARGVTAEVALLLAATCSPKLVLLGRSPKPESEPDWLAGLSVESDIKKALLELYSGISPKELQEHFKKITDNREALANITRLENTGATVLYVQVDIRDAAAVSSALEEVQANLGAVTAVFHGAGVLADKRIEDKTEEQFRNVYETKVDGLNNILSKIDLNLLRVLVLFSSSTARFGRTGQIDYAAANEVLNKTAQWYRMKFPQCRAIAVNWGPWAGGMVNPGLAKLFASEGVGLIPLEAGAHYLIKELEYTGAASSEVVVLCEMLPSHGGNVDEKIKTNESEPDTKNIKETAGDFTKAFNLNLNLPSFPFLQSHVLNNKAVLPVAMMVEWLAHGAMHVHPGMRFCGFDHLRVTKGVILGPDETVDLGFYAGMLSREDDQYRIPVELRTVTNDVPGRLHASAEMILGDNFPQSNTKPQIQTGVLDATAYNNGGLYGATGHLFHGPDFQGLESVEGGGKDLLAAQVKAAPVPESWYATPLRNSWIADPLILDSSFQMMILWCFQHMNMGSLPSYIKTYRQYQARFPRDKAHIRAKVIESNKHRAIADIEFLNVDEDRLVARMSGYECVMDASLNAAFKKNTLQKELVS